MPADLELILDYIAMMARGYGNRLKWNEVAKLKSDMMKVPRRWTPERAPVALVEARCLELGMTREDTATVIDLLWKTQAGRRLIPQHSYRNFAFKPPVE
ncbi:hypothetical protein A5680_07810 [Mycobacterium sp. E2989]|nr:hypothetical protein A5680_07810 [Mycobacterium sp. E2989]